MNVLQRQIDVEIRCMQEVRCWRQESLTADPALNITLASLPECSGSNTITRLEILVWYTFTTVDFCVADQVAVRLDNISCQSISGVVQVFNLYCMRSVVVGQGLWGQPLYCADKLLSRQCCYYLLLQPSTTYYILLDGFSDSTVISI